MASATETKPFGSDIGLIHKVVVAGRGCFAETRFWSALADDQRLFRQIVGLVEQMSVVQSNLGDPASAYPIKSEDVQPILDFFRELDEILQWKLPAEVYIFCPPTDSEFFCEEFDIREAKKRKLRDYLGGTSGSRILEFYFMKKICGLIRDMGLDPAELVRCLVPADNEGNFKMWRNVPFRRDAFVANLRWAIQRRKAMAALYAQVSD